MLELSNVREVAAIIDHTILKPAATWTDVEKVTQEGLEARTASVCVNPIWVRRVSEMLKDTPTVCCSVVGFPLGASKPDVIASEAEHAVEDGAREIDMVQSIGHAKMHDWKAIQESVAAVKEAIGSICLKVIFEVCELSEDEIRAVASASLDAGADFLKTSTGFGSHGATVESVRIMAETAQGKAGIKAAGGIKSFADLQRMVAAGATRIGASSTLVILGDAATHFPGENGS